MDDSLVRRVLGRHVALAKNASRYVKNIFKTEDYFSHQIKPRIPRFDLTPWVYIWEDEEYYVYPQDVHHLDEAELNKFHEEFCALIICKHNRGRKHQNRVNENILHCSPQR